MIGLSLLLAACSPEVIVDPPSGPILHGRIDISTTESGTTSSYQASQAAGQTLQLVVSPALPLSAASSTQVNGDLSYALELPINMGGDALIPLQLHPGSGCSYAQNSLSDPATMIGLGYLRIAESSAFPGGESLAVNARVNTIQNLGIAVNGIYREAGLIYSDREVQVDIEGTCPTLDGANTNTISQHFKLKKGWNVVQDTIITDAAGNQSSTVQVSQDLSRDLVLSR